MDRREFLRKSLAIGATTGATLLTGGFSNLFAAEKAAAGKFPDLVAIKGGAPETMFDAGIKALGGMGNFVKKGQTVVVKPNIGWDVPPELAANTNPHLVKRIIEHCYKAGAKKVYVFDNSCDYWKSCYKTSGIEAAAKAAGAQVVPANSQKYYKEVRIPKAKTLKKTKVHELILDTDVFINVPILKDHMASGLTIAMKNLMGVVWDRQYYHGSDLHECIAEFCLYRKPDLNIVDAYRILQQNGPRGVFNENDVALFKTQLISTDIVAVDAAAAKLFDMDPADVPHIQSAHDKKIGNMNLKELTIEKITV